MIPIILFFQELQEPIQQQSNSMDVQTSIWYATGLPGLFLAIALGWFIKVNHRLRTERDDKIKDIIEQLKEHKIDIGRVNEIWQQKFDKERQEKELKDQQRDNQYIKEREEFFKTMTNFSSEASVDRKEMILLIKQQSLLLEGNQELIKDFNNKGSNALLELARASMKSSG